MHCSALCRVQITSGGLSASLPHLSGSARSTNSFSLLDRDDDQGGDGDGNGDDDDHVDDILTSAHGSPNPFSSPTSQTVRPTRNTIQLYKLLSYK